MLRSKVWFQSNGAKYIAAHGRGRVNLTRMSLILGFLRFSCFKNDQLDNSTRDSEENTSRMEQDQVSSMHHAADYADQSTAVTTLHLP